MSKGLYGELAVWEVKLTETFKEWLLAQEKGLKKRIAASLLNLQQYGPSLPRPYAIQSRVRSIPT